MTRLIARSLIGVASASLALGSAVPASAQQYPAKPVRVVVSFVPGSSIDLTARALGQKVSESLKQPFIVENRAGGNTMVAAEVVARSAPDGYTIFHALDTTLTLVPALYEKVTYDALRDFAPVGLINQGSYILVTHAKAPYRTFNEMVAYAKANPGKMNFGASTAFTQLLTVMLKKEAAIDIQYVPYKGGPQMIQALMSGDLDVTVDGLALYPPLVKSGKMVGLVTTGAQRAPQFPDLPTMRELGLPQLEAPSWTAWFVPTGTPDAVVRRLNAEMNKVLSDPEFRRRNDESGQNPLMPTTPEQLGELTRQNVARWAPLVKAAGIKLD